MNIFSAESLVLQGVINGLKIRVFPKCSGNKFVKR